MAGPFRIGQARAVGATDTLLGLPRHRLGHVQSIAPVRVRYCRRRNAVRTSAITRCRFSAQCPGTGGRRQVIDCVRALGRTVRARPDAGGATVDVLAPVQPAAKNPVLVVNVTVVTATSPLVRSVADTICHAVEAAADGGANTRQVRCRPHHAQQYLHPRRDQSVNGVDGRPKPQKGEGNRTFAVLTAHRPGPATVPHASDAANRRRELPSVQYQNAGYNNDTAPEFMRGYEISV